MAKRQSTPADLPPASKHNYGRIHRPIESEVDTCACGMPEAIEIARHSPSCELRKAARAPWKPPADLDEALEVRKPTLPPVAVAPEPVRSGEQLALIALPPAPLPVRSAAQVVNPTKAITLEQAMRPSVCEIAINAPQGTDIRVAINLTGGAS